MDYKTYYCSQAKSNQIGTGLQIQGKAQLDPNNLEFLESQFNTISKNKVSKIKKVPKTKSGLRRKPKNNKNIKIKNKLIKPKNKKLNNSFKKISKAKQRKSKSKELDIFI